MAIDQEAVHKKLATKASIFPKSELAPRFRSDRHDHGQSRDTCDRWSNRCVRSEIWPTALTIATPEGLVVNVANASNTPITDPWFEFALWLPDAPGLHARSRDIGDLPSHRP